MGGSNQVFGRKKTYAYDLKNNEELGLVSNLSATELGLESRKYESEQSEQNFPTSQRGDPMIVDIKISGPEQLNYEINQSESL